MVLGLQLIAIEERSGKGGFNVPHGLVLCRLQQLRPTRRTIEGHCSLPQTDLL